MVTVVILCLLRLHCSGTVVILWSSWGYCSWWHCDDTVVIVVVAVFIVVALGRPVVTAGELGRLCDGVWSSRDSWAVRFLY